ncbi:MAG: HD domain-containing phosphohydrolase [bacterium JZ-2024 1]
MLWRPKEGERKGHFEVLRHWVQTQEAFTPFRHGHSERVAIYARTIAEKVKNVDPEKVWRAALLYDIGLLAVPHNVLLKADRLNSTEWMIVKLHPEVSAQVVRRYPDTQDLEDAILAHHERWDGTGYPSGLLTEAIPLAARIIAIADTFDALTQERPYRGRLTARQAKQVLETGAGEHWDPSLVNIAISVLPDEPVESVESFVPPIEVREYYENWILEFRRSSFLVKMGEGFRSLTRTDVYPRKILQIVQSTFPAYDGYLFASWEDDSLIVRAQIGSTDEVIGKKFPTSDPAIYPALESNQVTVISEIRRDSVFHELRERQGFHSLVVGPLIYEDRKAGIVALLGKEAGRMPYEDTQLLRLLIGTLAPAVDSMQTFERIESSLISDPVTGAYTPGLLAMRFVEEASRAQRYSEKLSLLVLDIPNYTEVEDLLGDRKSEVFLRQYYLSISGNLRASDIVGRLDRGTFLVLLPVTPAESVKVVVARLIKLLQAKFEHLVPKGLGGVTIAIGSATFPEDGAALRNLLEIAKQRSAQTSIRI